MQPVPPGLFIMFVARVAGYDVQYLRAHDLQTETG
jgi:hypothetical protein